MRYAKENREKKMLAVFVRVTHDEQSERGTTRSLAEAENLNFFKNRLRRHLIDFLVNTKFFYCVMYYLYVYSYYFKQLYMIIYFLNVLYYQEINFSLFV